MPPVRALSTRQLVYKTIFVPVEGTDPVQYIDSYQQVEESITLDMNNFNSIYEYIDEYGNVDTNLTYVILNNGETLLLTIKYEEANSLYINYLNGG
jgi:S-adenosylmethionine hydrolase